MKCSPAISCLQIYFSPLLAAVLFLLCSCSLFGCGNDWKKRLKFSCPPNPKYNIYHEAQRVPVGRDKLYIPVLTSKRPGSVAKQAIIIIFGAMREMSEMHESMKKIVGCKKWGQCQHNSITDVVVTPAFTPHKCTAREWNDGPRSIHSPIWAKGGEWLRVKRWIMGGYDDHSRITSYEALDIVVRWVERRYRKLQRIIVTGFSAGAQFLQRWITLTPLGVGGRSHYGQIAFRVIIGSPSTLVYLDHNRPDVECTADTKIDHSIFNCTSFSRATTNHTQCTINKENNEGPQCACRRKFDLWPYGLHDVLVNEDLLHDEICGRGGTSCVGEDIRDYVLQTSGNVSLGHVRRMFRTKDVRFLVGAKDQKSCNKGRCSNLCVAMVQGSTRLQRLINFVGYLRNLYDDYDPPFAVFEGGHDYHLAWNSPHFECWAFTDSDNATCTPEELAQARQERAVDFGDAAYIRWSMLALAIGLGILVSPTLRLARGALRRASGLTSGHERKIYGEGLQNDLLS